MADEEKRYQVIHDMGSGLLIVKVQLDSLVEQNVNARIMKDQMQDQLTANIQKRGQLESLPLVALIDGKLKMKDRVLTEVDKQAVLAHCRDTAANLWGRINASGDVD